MAGVGIQELLILLVILFIMGGFIAGVGLAVYFAITKGRQK